MKLCLINIKKYRRNDEDKVKLIFESETGQVYPGFALANEVKAEINEMQKVDTYDPAHARELELDIDVWDGKKTEKVIIAH